MLRNIEAPNTGLFLWKFFSFSIGYDMLEMNYILIELTCESKKEYSNEQ